MVTNRLRLHLKDDPEPSPPSDYWVVGGEYGWYYVSADVAAQVSRALARVWVPRWVSFTDLSGGAVRVLARDITFIYESTVAQRSSERAFRRARKAEDKAERDWDEE